MSAKNQSGGSKFVSSLGWILFVLALPALGIGFNKYKQAEAVLQRDACMANLKQIDNAKEEWALEKKKAAGETPDAGDLKPFLGKSLDDLKCPALGKYTVNAIGANPQCSVAGHKLP